MKAKEHTMQWFNNLKIRTKLLGAFVTILGLTVFVGCFGIARLNSAFEATQRITNVEMPAIVAIYNAHEAIRTIQRDIRQSMLVTGDEANQKWIASLESAEEKYQAQVDKLKALLSLETDKVGLAKLTQAYNQWIGSLSKVRELAAADHNEAAAEILFSAKNVALQTDIDAASADLLQSKQVRIATVVRESEAAGAHSKQLTVGVVILAVIVGLLIAFLIAHRISTPIRRVTEIAQHIAQGDLSQEISIEQQDEIGLLAHAFRQSIAYIRGIAEASETLSNGDLTVQVVARSDQDVLSHSFQRMSERLQQIVAEIREASFMLSSAASQLAQGNSDLSQRTQEQAAALEETASSMEEMTSTVQQNADNARQANQLAVGTRTQAEQGSGVVSQAVAAMAAISHSSRKIAEITGVIDGIAFQTNLLALNAAVEAARAGEQGRGFAVVAAEVRKLAQRSAEAAKEIKALIMDSGEKVESGAHLVDESGKALAATVSAVKQVSDIVAEIAAASQEQAAGIEQVNKAVIQMDEMTQQNASLVEEAAAASTAVEMQAQSLRQLMEFFTLETGVRDQEAGGSAAASQGRGAGRPLGKGVSRALVPRGQETAAGVDAGHERPPAHLLIRPREPRLPREPGQRRVRTTTNNTDGEWTEF